MRSLLFLLALLCSTTALAQLPNPGLNMWGNRTNIFSFAPFIPTDTFDTNEPMGWFTSNQVTGNGNIAPGNPLVTQVSVGSGSAARIFTDSLLVTTTIPSTISLVLPGFLVNGNFNFDLSAVILGGGTVSPGTIRGAGTPMTRRLESVTARVRYSPSPDDSLLIWAVLRKGEKVVAEAILQTGDTIASYSDRTATFRYYACDLPDTLVIMLASSTPDFSSLIRSGGGGIASGSIMWVDTVFTTDLPGSTNLGPYANVDRVDVVRNQAKSFPVLDNDQECDGQPLTISSFTTPLKGQLVLNANNTFTYTPNTNVVGLDSFNYSIRSGTDTSRTTVNLSISSFTAVDRSQAPQVRVYPNPVRDLLQLTLPFAEALHVQLRNSLGQLVAERRLPHAREAQLDLSSLAPGIYSLQLEGETLRERHAVLIQR